MILYRLAYSKVILPSRASRLRKWEREKVWLPPYGIYFISITASLHSLRKLGFRAKSISFSSTSYSSCHSLRVVVVLLSYGERGTKLTLRTFHPHSIVSRTTSPHEYYLSANPQASLTRNGKKRLRDSHTSKERKSTEGEMNEFHPAVAYHSFISLCYTVRALRLLGHSLTPFRGA